MGRRQGAARRHRPLQLPLLGRVAVPRHQLARAPPRDVQDPVVQPAARHRVPPRELGRGELTHGLPTTAAAAPLPLCPPPPSSLGPRMCSVGFSIRVPALVLMRVLPLMCFVLPTITVHDRGNLQLEDDEDPLHPAAHIRRGEELRPLRPQQREGGCLAGHPAPGPARISASLCLRS